jgi:hypothetical protein
MLCDGQTVPADTARKTCPAFLQLFGLCAWTKTYEASLRDRTTNKKKLLRLPLSRPWPSWLRIFWPVPEVDHACAWSIPLSLVAF